MFCHVTENLELNTPYINPVYEYTSRLPELYTCCYCQPLDLSWKLNGNEKILSVSKNIRNTPVGYSIVFCQDRKIAIVSSLPIIII